MSPKLHFTYLKLLEISKTHKINNPIRPIISQVTTPTYHNDKTIAKILTPYISQKYMLRSTDDLIDLLQKHEYCGYIASLNVESFFTNVPVDDTINIIIETIYNNNNINGMKPPKIPVKPVSELLNICTKDLIFRTPKDCYTSR